MNYKELSEQILQYIGGEGNIASFTNCMTRLRINVKNQEVVDLKSIGALKGVMGTVAGEQMQIIVGPGHAQRLADAFGEIVSISPAAEDGAIDTAATQEDMKNKVKAAQNSAWQRGLKHVGNIFIPLIPGFVATGLFAAIANLIKSTAPQVPFFATIVASPWFLVLSGLGGLLLGMLHILAGYNAGKEFGGTPVLGAIAGGLIYMPALAGIAAKTNPVTAAVPLVLPFVNITLSPALGGVIGVILAAYMFVQIEKFLRKYIPAMLDLFLVPFLTVLIGGIITLVIVMPIAALVMKGITVVLIDFMLKKGGVIGGFVLSASFLPLVMLGIHHGLTPIHAQLINDPNIGFTVLLPILAMAGAGQVGAALAVFVKTKNKDMKELIGSALPAGILGVGEPLIYGVSLPLFYPFITACLGAGFGGLVLGAASQFGNPVGAITVGPSGLILVTAIANGQWYMYLLGMVVSYAGGFILTYLFGYKESMLERLK